MNMTVNDSKKHILRNYRKNGYNYALKTEVAVIKPKIENIVKSRKKSIVQVLRKLSENGLEEPSKGCICKREPCNIVCSGKGCDYSFTGRIAASCDLHPGDKYLMDHPSKCPRCKGNLSMYLINFIDNLILITLLVESNACKDDVFNDSKPLIVAPVLTSTPKERKARTKKVFHDNASKDQVIRAS